MANRMPVSGAAAGTAGSPYVAQVTTLAKAVGNYVINEANFPGIGKYLPGLVLIVGVTPANVTLSYSFDNGTTWVAQSNTGGGFVYVDGQSTVRINIATGATDIRMFPLAI